MIPKHKTRETQTNLNINTNAKHKHTVNNHILQHKHMYKHNAKHKHNYYIQKRVFYWKLKHSQNSCAHPGVRVSGISRLPFDPVTLLISRFYVTSPTRLSHSLTLYFSLCIFQMIQVKFINITSTHNFIVYIIINRTLHGSSKIWLLCSRDKNNISLICCAYL